MEFIDRLDEPRRSEIQRLHDLIRDVAPGLTVDAGPRMLGYGRYHYRYDSGREGDSHLISLASNKTAISVYVNSVKDGRYLPEGYRERLPKAKIGKSCVSFKRTSDLDLDELRALLTEAVALGPPHGVAT